MAKTNISMRIIFVYGLLLVLWRTGWLVFCMLFASLAVTSFIITIVEDYGYPLGAYLFVEAQLETSENSRIAIEGRA